MNPGKTEMVINLRGIMEMMGSSWGYAEGQTIGKARGRASVGEGVWDKVETNDKGWLSAWYCISCW